MADKQDGASEQFMGWAMLLAIFAVLVYGMWWLWSDEIGGAIRWLRVGEMWLIGWLIPSDYMVQWNGYNVNFHEWMQAGPGIPASDITWETVSVLSTVALEPLRWVTFALTLAIGLWALFKGPGSQYVERFNMDGLIRHQSKVFPAISPIVNFNPAQREPRPPGTPVPAELPLFAEALGPEEWIAYNSIPVPDGKIDEKAAAKAFSKQLGPRWKGLKSLAPYKQILLASFCLKANRKRSESDEMLGRLSRCWSHDKGLNLSHDSKLLKEAQRILKNRDMAAKFLAKCNQHGWETTALMRGLITAREQGGVLAPAQFLWLRGHDRALWYPLNNTGRYSYHMEALGAMAHYKAEKLAERPIPYPKMQDAVTAMSDYLGSDIARPIPQLDYSASKNKRGIKKLKTA